MPEPVAEDPLAALRTHVRDAQLAAERLAHAARGDPGAEQSATADPPGGGAGSGRGHGEGVFTDAGGGGATGPAGSRTPPSGWDAPPPAQEASAELRTLVALLESLRAMLPEELREQLNDLIRQILLLMRAVIDWLVLGMEREAPSSPAEPIEDIPIS